MKQIFIILALVELCLAFSACSKLNVFNEPPGYPVIDSLFPAEGTAGTQLRLYGSGFSFSSSRNRININGVALEVDSPSSSTVLLVHLVDSTGTGKVHVSVEGREGDGPVFTYLSGAAAAGKPRITGVQRGWHDGTGYALFVTHLSAQNGAVQVKAGGVPVAIYGIIRPNDTTQPVEIRLEGDGSLEDHAAVNFVDIQVGNGDNYSAPLRYQIVPRYISLQQNAYHGGDTMIINGRFLGLRTQDSRVVLSYHDTTLSPDVTILTWTNDQITVKLPDYPVIRASAAWGDRDVVNYYVQVGALRADDNYTFLYIIGSGSAQAVSTFAGSTIGYADGQGGAAQFSTPWDLVTDPQGNMYVTDETNNRVRKITPDAKVTTVAGDGTFGYRDGPAMSAWFKNPASMTMDPQGNLYVADLAGNCVRKISTTGAVTRFAGDTTFGYAEGKGEAARFNVIAALVSDKNGNIYVADYNRRIRKITPDGTVSTMAGNGTFGSTDGPVASATFGVMTGMTIDGDGTLYVAEISPRVVIRRVVPGGNVTTLAGDMAGYADGQGGTARFNAPSSMVVDAGHNIYVCDKQNNMIRRIDPNYMVTTLAGNGSPESIDGDYRAASFYNPIGITLDPQQRNLYVTGFDHRIRKIRLH